MKLFILCSSSNDIPQEYFEDCKITEKIRKNHLGNLIYEKFYANK